MLIMVVPFEAIYAALELRWDDTQGVIAHRPITIGQNLNCKFYTLVLVDIHLSFEINLHIFA
jgi:hypothetical protein